MSSFNENCKSFVRGWIEIVGLLFLMDSTVRNWMLRWFLGLILKFSNLVQLVLFFPFLSAFHSKQTFTPVSSFFCFFASIYSPCLPTCDLHSPLLLSLPSTCWCSWSQAMSIYFFSFLSNYWSWVIFSRSKAYL